MFVRSRKLITYTATSNGMSRWSSCALSDSFCVVLAVCAVDIFGSPKSDVTRRPQLDPERTNARRFVEAMHVCDVRVIQSSQRLRLALEAGDAVRPAAKASCRMLIATSRSSFGARAVDLAPPAGSDGGKELMGVGGASRGQG